MTRQLFLLMSSAFFMTSCGTYTPENTDKENPSDVFTQLYTIDNLNTQSFTIDNAVDNIITGINGTIIRIYKNTFVDQHGKPATSKVEVKLIEVLTPIDRVLGNLTTTFENRPLETGGMIFIDAVASSKQLSIAEDKNILIKMPTDSTLVNMSVFEGQKDSIGISWSNPVPIPQINKKDSVDFGVNAFEKTRM